MDNKPGSNLSVFQPAITSPQPKARIVLISILSMALLNGCATPHYQPPDAPAALVVSETEQQQSEALQHRLAQQLRLSRVSWPLLTANAEICADQVRPLLGFQFGNSHTFGSVTASEATTDSSDKTAVTTLRDSAIRTFGLGEALQILTVVPGSPADQSGIQPGDRLISLNQQSFLTGKAATADASERFRQFKPQSSADLKSAPPAIKLQLYRQQQLLTVRLQPVNGCDYPLVIINSDAINAFADHRSIFITEGMLDFASDDRDLALVLAHELAHNVLAHVPATSRNGLIGTGIDLLLWSHGIPSPGAFTIGGLNSYSKAFESEADYISLYLLARANYPLAGGADFWRKMSHSRPAHIQSQNGQSHPGSADRFVRMQAAIEEIVDKQQRQLPLAPTIRP
ncbi:MAG: M48 family metalloprotease [Motiliproteus sp.]